MDDDGTPCTLHLNPREGDERWFETSICQECIDDLSEYDFVTVSPAT